jgi:alkylhydroperoxidase/carboxymuconolactone decarboxylase family protein YurZ
MERRDGRWLIVDHRLTGVDSEPHRPDIGNEWYGGHPGHLAPGPIPDAADVARRALADAVPTVGAGLDRIRGAAEGDGALPAGTKALLTAAAAAASARPQTLLRAMTRMRDAEVPAEHAWAAAAALALSRGDEAAGRLVSEILAHYGPPEAGVPATAPGVDEARAYFEGYFGTIPDRVELMAQQAPEVFTGYSQLHFAALRDGALERKVVELLLCAVNAAEYQSAFVEIHAGAARAAGASEAELVEAIVTVIPVAGVAAWAAAAGALAAT